MRKTARLIALTLAMLIGAQCVASAEAKFRRKVFNPKPVAVETETEIEKPEFEKPEFEKPEFDFDDDEDREDIEDEDIDDDDDDDDDGDGDSDNVHRKHDLGHRGDVHVHGHVRHGRGHVHGRVLL